MIDHSTLVVLVGVSILGAGAGLVGTFAVLRRRALTGDALAHASLPGICLAFLITGEKRLPLLLLGAFLSGLLGLVVIAALRRYTRIKEDASVGVVLSVFFGAGLVLSGVIQNTIPGGSKAGVNTYILGQAATMVTEDVTLIAACSLACLVLVLLLYKEFKLVAFDAGFARVQGWPAARLDLLLMTLLAVMVMIGLPAVGAVLMAALLILPGATGRLWTDRLSVSLFLAGLFGAVAGGVGTLVSSRASNIPTGPAVILTGTAIFLASLLLAPRHGLLARGLARWRFNRELEQRHLLRILYELVEAKLPQRLPVGAEQLAGRRAWSVAHVQRLLRGAAGEGLLEGLGDGRYLLTPEGLRRAAAATRGYRLWSLYLAEFPDQAGSVVNLAEESIDGLLPSEMVEDLERQLSEQNRLPTPAGVPTLTQKLH